MSDPITIWALTEGHIGMENQARGVAEAVVGDGPGRVPGRVVVKRIAVNVPWLWLPPGLWPAPLMAVGTGGDTLTPPWPDVVISCGKRAVAPCAAIRRKSGGSTIAVHIQQPNVPSDRFDLIVVPEHDDLRGENVHVTRAAVHRVTRERLAAEAGKAKGKAGGQAGGKAGGKDGSKDIVVVLIGGSNNRHRLTDRVAQRLGEQLAALCSARPTDLRITPSRRTDPSAVTILRDRLAGTGARIWDGSGDNPYFSWLAVADFVLVTWDSVSMTSEALATGQPVYVLPLDGKSRRIDRFQARLREQGYTRPFTGTLDRWTYDPPDDTAEVAAVIRTLLAERRA